MIHTSPAPGISPWTRIVPTTDGCIRVICHDRRMVDLGPQESAQVVAYSRRSARQTPTTASPAAKGYRILARLGQLESERNPALCAPVRRHSNRTTRPVRPRNVQRTGQQSHAEPPAGADQCSQADPPVLVLAPTTWHATLSAALTLITRNLVLLPAQPTAAELAVAMPTAVGAILVGELDWAVAQQFQRAGVAHLLLSPGARSAAASSWVTPGSSPCLRCQYLCVRDADPQWANVLAQLHNWPTPDPDPLLVHACGLYVANAVRTHLKQAAVMGDAPAQIGLLGAIPNANRSEFHPGCGCARGVATEKTRVAA